MVTNSASSLPWSHGIVSRKAASPFRSTPATAASRCSGAAMASYSCSTHLGTCRRSWCGTLSMATPPGIGEHTLVHAAVLRAAALGDIHHFQVVLVSTDEHNTRLIGRVYSSETGVWGNLIATPLPPSVTLALIDPSKPDVLVGDSLDMLIHGKSLSIVEFDVDRRSLALIPLPVGLDLELSYYCWLMRADGGGLGLLFVSMSECSFQLWKRKTDCDGIASWVLARTIELDKLLSLDLQCGLKIQGFTEENNVVFLRTFVGCFMVQLDSLQFKKLPDISIHQWHPFECVYAAGI